MIQSDSWRTVLSFNFIGPILKTYIIALDGRFFFIIFAFLIVISTLWLKRYRLGPLEWVWRVLTYGRYMKNRLQ